MFFTGAWRKAGVWNVEEFDPNPFMEELNRQGLPWQEIFDGDLEVWKNENGKKRQNRDSCDFEIKIGRWHRPIFISENAYSD